ncbi:MAG: hypothetical protein NTX86_05690 [Candidatus Dependentiae bacterium]|nr:hypothetical protein [Candidatus Dependentiae bacterium]
MIILDKISTFIAQLEERKFYIYLGVVIGILVLIMSGIVFYRYNSMNYWKKRINHINEIREEISEIISKDQQVLSQRAEVNATLAEMPDFKIEGYFNELLKKLNLERNKQTSATSPGEKSDSEYREVLLKAKFDTMTMQQLTELLNEIDQNKRIYTKELEITKSTKTPKTIDVNVTIATLQRKPEQTELVE